MNREIKFKFWDSTNKIMMLDSDGWNENAGINEMFTELRRYETIPLQYTGLKDKNGKEIYEGDIVELTAQLPITRCKVEWKDCGFVLTGTIPWQNKRVEFSEDQLNKRWENNYIEIIGNIYENPDLLP